MTPLSGRLGRPAFMSKDPASPPATRHGSALSSASRRSFAEGQLALPVIAGTDRPACSDNAPYGGAVEHPHRPLRRNRVSGNSPYRLWKHTRHPSRGSILPVQGHPSSPGASGAEAAPISVVQPRARLSRVPHATLQARTDRSRKVPALRRLAVRFGAAHTDRSHRSWTGDAACQPTIRLSPSESGPRAQALSCRQGDAEPVKVLATTRKLGSFGGRQPVS